MYTEHHAGRKGNRTPPSLYLTAPKAKIVKTTTGWRDGNEHSSQQERSRLGEASGNPAGVGRAWQAWRETFENLGDPRGPATSWNCGRHGMCIINPRRGNPGTKKPKPKQGREALIDLERHGMRRWRHGRGNPDTGQSRSLQRQGLIPNLEPRSEVSPSAYRRNGAASRGKPAESAS